MLPYEYMDSDDESDTMSVTTTPFSPASSDAGQHDGSDTRSMRSISPSSVWSMSSSLRASAYREEYGRRVNNYSDVYRLAADEEELERLSKQHLIFREAMGGRKYCAPMTEVLEEKYSGQHKACLDLGCGSGSWILDVARDFPRCEAVAVDLVPLPTVDMPENCRCEVDDINLGLEHFYDGFDVVHTRLISSGIKNYRFLIDEMNRSLKPGGLLDISEFDFHAYDENYRRIELSPTEFGAPWWARWLCFAKEAAESFGGEVDAATHLYDWVKEHGGFEDIVYHECWLPCSTWPKENTFEHKIGQAMKEDNLAFMQSGRPLLLGRGHSEEVVDALTAKATAELMEAKTPAFVRLQCVYARRRHDYKPKPK